ncbi:MAG TPA: hypothetical protein P5523_06780 [Bacteroidales bacterium]|jgi:hypothetical protein|nr:hypothetical protein [Prolixibacteraceae bacterium]HRT84327.1 hypothetical protein [Bacteroidales bacterium]
MTEHNKGIEAHQTRKIGFILILGIVFIPFVFVWFILKPGYSKTARLIGFSWLIIILLIIIIPYINTKKPVVIEKSVVEESSIVNDSIVADTSLTTPQEVVEVSLDSLMPQKEKNLIEILKKAWEKDKHDYSEAEKYKLIKERKNSIANGYQMTEWVGTVFDTEYNQKASEIGLVIILYKGKKFYEEIKIGTGSSADPKYRVPTTIKEGTALFNKAIELKPGDKVRFSGTLYLKDFCPWNTEWADDNPLDSFAQLSFLTKFTKLERID